VAQQSSTLAVVDVYGVIMPCEGSGLTSRYAFEVSLARTCRAVAEFACYAERAPMLLSRSKIYGRPCLARACS